MSSENTIDAVRLALNLQDIRARVAGMNVANANKPDATALRVDFAKVEIALREAARAGNEVEASRWLATAGQELGIVEPATDGEQIRLDREIGDIATAGVEYQALTEALNRQFGLMRIAIAGEDLNMPVDTALEAVRAGMDYERLRLDAASRNIANANVPVAHGKAATLWRVDGSADFARVAGMPGDAVIGEREAQTREVHDPGHPMSNAEGMVRYPAVDMVQEMTTLMTASRGYEANVRSFNFLRNMMLRAIEIGAK